MLRSAVFSYDVADVYLTVAFDAADSLPEITVTFSGQERTEITAQASDDGSYGIRVPDSFCLITGECVVERAGVGFPIKSPLEFDKNKANDINYITMNVFNFRTRLQSKNEFYHLLRCVRRIMKANSDLYWGVTSVLGFRVAEAPTERAALGRQLVDERAKACDHEQPQYLSPVYLRWWVSSGATLIPLAELYGQRSSAIRIGEQLYSIRSDVAKTQIVYWNLASATFLYALYLYGEGKREAAQNIFLHVFEICRQGIEDLFNARNESVLTQYPDCVALVEIGRNAFASHAVLSGRRFMAGTRYPYPIGLEHYYIDFVGTVRRHPKEFVQKLSYYIRLKDRLNQEKNALFAKPQV